MDTAWIGHDSEENVCEELAMVCSTCGNPLSPGSPYCPRCGTLTATTPPPTAATMPDQPAERQTEGWEHLTYESRPARRAQTAFYGRYGMRHSIAPPPPSSLTPRFSLPQTSTATGAFTHAAPPEADGPVPSGAEAAPTHAPTGGAPARTTQPAHTPAPAKTPPPPARRPFSARVVALAAILLLITLLAGIGTLGYHAYKNNQMGVRATATASARANATATALAHARATATALLFSDPLTSNVNGWTEDGTYSFFKNDQYHLHNPDPMQTLNSYYQRQSFSNFRAEVTVTAYATGNPTSSVPYAYGLVLRADPTTPSNKYVFFVSPTGTYNFSRHDVNGLSNNGWTDLLSAPWATSSAIHTGKGVTNTLMVLARDNTFTLFINGKLVETVTDTTGGITAGWIGVMVEGADMEAGFSHLRVYGPGL